MKFITGTEILSRLDLKEVAETLALDEHVYHGLLCQQIFMPKDLQKTPTYEHSLNKISILLDSNCFALEIPKEVFEFFDVSITSGLYEFSLQPKVYSEESFTEYRIGQQPTKLFSISPEKYYYLTPRNWTITKKIFENSNTKNIDKPKLSFTLRADNASSFTQLNQYNLKFVSHTSLDYSQLDSINFDGCSSICREDEISNNHIYPLYFKIKKPNEYSWIIDFPLNDIYKAFTFAASNLNVLDIKNDTIRKHIFDVLKLVGVPLSYLDNIFYIARKDWIKCKKENEHLLQNNEPDSCGSFMPQGIENKQLVNDRLPLYSNLRHKFSLHEELKRSFLLLDKEINTASVEDEEKILLSVNTLKSLLLITYPFLHLLGSECGIKVENFIEVSSLNTVEKSCKISIESDSNRYALTTDSNDFYSDINLFCNGFRSTFGDLSDLEYKNHLLFLWKNKASYSKETSAPLKHQDEYFEFDEELFIELYHYKNPKEGRNKYIEILKSYRYDADAVERFERRKMQLPETEKEVRDTLVKIYKKIKAELSPHIRAEKYLSDNIDKYIKILNKTMLAKNRYVPSRAQDKVGEYANAKNIPFIRLDNRNNSISSEKLEEIKKTIAEYNSK